MKNKAYYCKTRICRSPIKDDRKSCTVLSAAVAFDIDYWTMNEYMKSYRRVMKNGKLGGCMSAKWVECLEGLVGRKMQKGQTTLGRFVIENPKGRFIVGVDGHALTVIDGVVYDSFLNGKRKRVEEFIKIA